MSSLGDLIDEINNRSRQSAGRALPLTYRVYTVKKPGGGTRRIAEPSPALKGIQKQLAAALRRLPAGPYAAAYEPDCSIRKNALRHRRGRYMLHADIKDFFPSVGKASVVRLAQEKYGLDDRQVAVFWNLVSYEGGLPIGAPTSPFIANRVMADIDVRLKKLRWFTTYSRYADDLVFSAKKPFDKAFAQKVERVLRSEGFKLNGKKTYFMHNRREVTGLILTDKGWMSVGTGYKKRLKKDIYDLLTKNKGNRQKIMGRFAHLRQIEPTYAKVIFDKYVPFDRIKFFGRKLARAFDYRR
ncbi:MAG: reverse transcriptase family protein [Clostridiales bacterium]|jgi:RNA-directed DNA polymerase|nr:reverse transcriptase family protein [Clostridiales bacterium]